MGQAGAGDHQSFRPVTAHRRQPHYATTRRRYTRRLVAVWGRHELLIQRGSASGYLRPSSRTSIGPRAQASTSAFTNSFPLPIYEGYVGGGTALRLRSSQRRPQVPQHRHRFGGNKSLPVNAAYLISFGRAGSAGFVL